MILDNPDEIKQNRGKMPEVEVSKAIESLLSFSKDLRRGKI
jgi:hypothetical protein